MINDDRKIEVRLFGALLAVTLASNMVIDALWILSQETIISKVARLSTYPEALSFLWLITAALVLPYFLSRNLDYAFVTESFVVMSVLSMSMAAALAHGLNAAQIRKEEALKEAEVTTPAEQEQKDIDHCTEAVEQQRKEDVAL